jgi:LysM repeat protein
MRAVREIVGGLMLAVLAGITVAGGLFLAVTEGGIAQNSASPSTVPATARVAAVTAPPATAPAAAMSPPAPTNTPQPSLTSTEISIVTLAPSDTVPAPSDTVIPSETSPASQEPSATATPTPPPPAPSTATPCAPPAAWVPYVVAPGDTLFQLGLRYGLSTAQLQAANCLPSASIKYGQVLYVPFAPSATATVTQPAPTATPIPLPLRLNGVTVTGVQADKSRPNGAIATVFVDFTGGAAPFTIYNDDVQAPGNPFAVLTDCDGTLIHTFKVISADGQSAQRTFYVGPIQCP